MYFLLKVSCRFVRSAIFRELNMSELEYTLLDVQHNWGHYEVTLGSKFAKSFPLVSVLAAGQVCAYNGRKFHFFC